jgi:multiple sugar transport system substrate-binding protein
MKQFFIGAIAVAALLYGLAELSLERPADDGVIRIRWATDPNPARNLQVEIFGKMQVLLKDEDVLDWARFSADLALPLAASRGRTTLPPARQRLRDLLTEQKRGGASPASPPDRPKLLAAVNRLLERPDLFRREDLEELDLSRDAKLLLARPRDELTKVEVVALNRRILEAAYPRAIRKAQRIEASVESGAREKLIVQCATGTGPDVIDVYGVAHMMTLVEAGVLVDVTRQAAEMGFAPGNTYPSIEDNLLVDGRQYRYPCNVWANCVIYNRAIFDDHDVPYPQSGWTYDQFVEIGKRITAGAGKSGRKHLAVANFSNIWMYNDFLLGSGGRYFTPDGLVSRLDSPKAVAAMQLYCDMMHVHKVIPTPAEAAAMSSQGGWGSGAINWFSNGQAAMIFIGRWYLCQLPNYPALRGKLSVVRLPRMGDRPSQGVCDTRAAGINITSPHRGAALKFLQYLAGEAYGRVIVNDGDSLPPNPALARTGEDLVNACAPEPGFHQPFIDAMAPARPLDFSPFIDAGQVDRWVVETISKVENGLVAPPEAMRALAAEINQRIRRNLARRGDLRRKFAKVTGKAWTEGWGYRRVAEGHD